MANKLFFSTGVEESILCRRYFLCLLFVLVLMGKAFGGEPFEKFRARLLLLESEKEIQKERKAQNNLFQKTKNTYYFYNVKFIDFLLEKRKNNETAALSHLNFIINTYHRKDKEQLAWMNYQMAQTLTYSDGLTVGEEYGLQALRLTRKKNYPGLRENLYSLLGINYFRQRQFQKAAGYFQKSFALTSRNNQQIYLSSNALNDIGVCYGNLRQYDQALNYHHRAKALILSKENRSIAEESLANLIDGNIGGILLKLKQYDKAERLLTKELNFYRVHTEYLDIGAARTMIDLLKIYEKKRSTQKCQAMISQLQTFEKNKKDPEISLLVNDFFYAYYLKKGNTERVVEISKTLIRDAHSSKKEAIERLTTLNNLVYSEKIVNLKKNTYSKSKLLQDALAEKKNSQITSSIFALFFLVVIILIILFNRNARKTHLKNKLIKQQNVQIIDSINYSKKIQDALLPNIGDMRKVFKKIFVLNRPKDIVSGDFYWFKKFGNHSIISCADCTGHGVPGGFMSTIGSLVLDKTTITESVSPSQILHDLNDEIIRILHQKYDGEIQDGMDLSICVIDHQTNKIAFSGARNGIIVVKNGTAQRYKADLLPVGGNYVKKGKPIVRSFSTQTIDLSSEDWVYMYTDGFIEQIGGTENLPMNFRSYEKILLAVSATVQESEKISFLENALKDWQGSNQRTDDVLLLGFQINSI
jgi:serine phosphatase RsbU (regulator of sigma subunit)/Flp pilus assembly protein TadD